MSKDEIAAAGLRHDRGNGASTDSREGHFIDQFKKYTQDTYGVPVTLVWDDTNGALQRLSRRTTTSDIGLDVMDDEEDHMPQFQELGWIEKSNDPKYNTVLTNWAGSKSLHTSSRTALGSSTQGFKETSGWSIRKDKVDVTKMKDWTDLAEFPALNVMMYMPWAATASTRWSSR